MYFYCLVYNHFSSNYIPIGFGKGFILLKMNGSIMVTRPFILWVLSCEPLLIKINFLTHLFLIFKRLHSYNLCVFNYLKYLTILRCLLVLLVISQLKIKQNQIVFGPLPRFKKCLMYGEASDDCSFGNLISSLRKDINTQKSFKAQMSELRLGRIAWGGRFQWRNLLESPSPVPHTSQNKTKKSRIQLQSIKLKMCQ